jgi:hypothetical protein
LINVDQTKAEFDTVPISVLVYPPVRVNVINFSYKRSFLLFYFANDSNHYRCTLTPLNTGTYTPFLPITETGIAFEARNLIY